MVTESKKKKSSKKKKKPSAQEQVGGKVNSGLMSAIAFGGMAENKNRLNESLLYEEWEEYGVEELLYEFIYDKENGIQQKKWSLIPKEQYKNLLWRFMDNPSMARIPRNIVFNWFQKIIIRNTLAISHITELAGHAQYMPTDYINDVFNKEFDFHDYDGQIDFLDEIGFYDWCKLPDGSNAWSDYGLEPLVKIINEYNESMSGEDILILINRCLDVYHQRGDLASAFIEGGSKTCSEISENNEPDFVLGAEKNEVSPYYHIMEAKNDKGESVPDKCDDCGGDIKTFIKGEPVYLCTDCGKYYGTVPFVNEGQIEPNDVDLSSFTIKSNLNNKFWKGNKLDSRIRMKLLDIADDFIDYIGINPSDVSDIIITGSIANYNWSEEYSDIDLHILVDYSTIDRNIDFVKEYFQAKKSLWNETHKNIMIYGFPFELYVQDTDEVHSSSGVYSIETNQWVVQPEKETLTTSKINKNFIKDTVSSYMNKIEKLQYLFNKSLGDEYKLKSINKQALILFNELKRNRRIGFELSGGKEINNYNICFKALRRFGYIDELYNIITLSYDKLQSIEKNNV